MFHSQKDRGRNYNFSTWNRKMFKPLLAAEAELAKLKFPLLASPKLDGVRALGLDGRLLSRSLKPIRNKHTQTCFSACQNIDGELIVGDPTAKDCYLKTVSGVMREDGEPDVFFHAFDHIADLDAPFEERFARIGEFGARVLTLPHTEIRSLDHLLAHEQHVLDLGYEGLILRDPRGRYKCGRSTAKEGILLKLKRFMDAEFEIVGFEERMHNGNEATTNELGRTKRSSHKAGKTGRGDLGALILQGDGFTFNCGTGMDDELRAEIWANREKYLGKLAKVKYFAVGMKDAPRHPVFLGFRSGDDR